MTYNRKERKSHSPPLVVKGPILEVKEILKPPSSFSLENEIQNIRIPVPLSKLIKHEDFKRCLSKAFQPEPTPPSIDSVNLQDENTVVMLVPLIEDRNDSSPPFDTSFYIHDKVLHNCLIYSGACHNIMPNIVMKELGLEVTKTY
jgi:hypothetical protein